MRQTSTSRSLSTRVQEGSIKATCQDTLRSRDYVQGEIQHGYEGAVYLDSLAFNRFVTALTSQIILSTLCAFLTKIRQVWLFSAHLLPLVARLIAVPHTVLLTVNTFSMVLTAIEVAAFLLSNLFVPYKLARSAYREILQIEVTELYRLLAVGISLWNQFAVPALLSVFWFILFMVQIYSSATASNNFLSEREVHYVFLTRDYVQGEIQHGYEGAVYLDSLAFNRFVTALTSQIILSTLCAFLTKIRQVWLFSAHLLPLVARLIAVPHTVLLTVNTFSMVLTAIEVAAFLLSNLFVPYKLARSAYREILQIEVTELYRLLAVGISLWNQFAVPALLSVFWFILFMVQIYSSASASNNFLSEREVHYVFLTSVSECCSTPYSLLGLSFVVSYLALGLLNLCKLYLGGYAAVQNENFMHSLLNCFQCKVKAVSKHLVKVLGTLLIYMLFMIELVRRHPIECLDEIIYYVNAGSRVLEFLVALCVVCYGTLESLFGEWSWMGASVIIIHSYFNVWLRAQSGWKSFLLRQEAAKKISSLPRATAQQLERHNDLCAICFQEMNSAVVTYCGHFFHANCLRKWLYIQETCPMCHQQVKPSVSQQNRGAEEGQAPEAQEEGRREAFQASETGTRASGFRPAHGAGAGNAPDDSQNDQEDISLSEGSEGESDENTTCEGDSLGGEEQTSVPGLCLIGNVVGNIDPVIQNTTLVAASPLTAEESSMNIMKSDTDEENEENFKYTSLQGVGEILTNQRSTVEHAATLSPGLTFQPAGGSGDCTDKQSVQVELSHN
ncbi:UNVERIFIED_CONTAM: hypothetical protein FKN15_033700 [Acipenser sinensis]